MKAYIKRNKHDAADAEAICEAVGRPTMRFVPIKTADQQAAVLLHPPIYGRKSRILRLRANERLTARGLAGPPLSLKSKVWGMAEGGPPALSGKYSRRGE